MSKSRINHKGVALYMVLGTLLVVIVLANVVLSIILSQSRLTHHQVSRIQAYYAAMAGVNLAFEKLRRGDWAPASTQIRYYCINGPVDTGVICIETVSDPPPDGILYNVQIAIYPNSQPGISDTTRIDAKVNYAYTP